MATLNHAIPLSKKWDGVRDWGWTLPGNKYTGPYND